MSSLTTPSVARLSVAFVFLYHGLVPKLLLMHPSEIALVQATPTFGMDPEHLLRAAGIAEVLLAVLIVGFWKKPWPLYGAALALAGLLGATLIFAPEISVAAFNPISLSVTTLALVWIALQRDRAHIS